MRISKRDKALLVILAMAILILIYYYFIMLPQEAKIEEQQILLEEKRNEKAQVDILIASEAQLDERISVTEAAIAVLASELYGNITHEEILMTIDQFSNDITFDPGDLTFLNNSSEQEGGVRHTANVNFTGSYFGVMDFLKNVEQNERKVAVKEISVVNEYDDSISGNVVLEFSGSDLVDVYDGDYRKLVSSNYNYRDIIPGPFKPYEGFDLAEAVVNEPNPEMDVDYPILPEEPIDYEEYNPRTTVYGFEDGDVFFVGNSPDIDGYVTRSKTKISGGYSSELVFDFVSARMFSEANVVFESNPIVLTRQAETLGMWVFAYEASDHAIGAVIIDSKGKEYRVEFTSQVDWTLWEEIEATMPVEITYPAMVQRIYVEGIGYDQKLTGKYLFDQLQVSYPVY